MIDMFSDERFMSEAFKQAEMAYEEGEIPVGAVVVCKHKIIARAYNQVERLNDVTAHAEMLAITAAQNYLGSKYLNECALFVTLEPCSMCAGASYWAQLGRIVYGAADEKRGYHCYNEALVHPKTEVSHGIMAQESQALISNFFDKLRNKNS